MTALDMALVLLMGGMAVTGFLRGFVQEVLSLLAWVVAVVAVRLFLAPITDLAGVWIGAGATASLLAFGGLFALTFLAGKLIAGRVGQGVRSSVIGPMDRVLGAGFGALKGLVVATLAFLAFSLAYQFFFGKDGGLPGWISTSRSYPLLNASGEAMSQMIGRRMNGEDALAQDEAGDKDRTLADEENAQ
ncbi:CvpA family protein [Sphingobium sp. DEHP117]|uniref:CvpA family protein n=1 Tax=Sphingobium sp. DEHP117 TaxID=2993436 RepID=UPI0027D6FED8|nr:CvpA family protein [Sphingobium sp. DEHP117]MDQ4419930.1 CvpA family protein [Sphingobium sp. DEHP117]